VLSPGRFGDGLGAIFGEVEGGAAGLITSDQAEKMKNF